MPTSDFAKKPKPNRKKPQSYSLKPETVMLVEAVAKKHGISNSLVVDIALEKYLTRVLEEKV